MRIGIFTLGVALAGVLCGQHKFSWQDACFKNPSAPFCQGHEDAVKRPPSVKAPPSQTIISNPFNTSPRNAARSAAPALIVVGAIDWRFIDPFADAVVGLNFNALSTSPLARDLITQLGAKQGLGKTDIQKIFDGLSGVDQVAVSVRDNRVVVMITGAVANAALPVPEAGLKAVSVSGNTMVVGHAEAVDQAVQRLAGPGSPSELGKVAEQRQSTSGFWVTASARLVGPQAASAGVKRFSLSASIRERLASDMAFEFQAPPNAKILQMLESTLGATTVEGNAVHARASMEPAEVRQKFAQIVESPLGDRLAAMIEAARYLPMRDPSAPKQTKPVIYGLDDGPKVVN